MEYSVNISTYNLDLSDTDSIRDFAKYLHSNQVQIDVLVNNAGTAKGGTLLMTPLNDVEKVFRVNFYAPLLLTQYVAKNMIRAKKNGAIINICSIAGLDPMEGFTIYGSSKAALAHASKIWAKELAKYGIRVNAIAPSAVNTEMASQMDEKTRELLIEKSFQNRMAEPIEIAKVAYFLGSEASSYINGQVIRVDGGM